MIRRGAIMEMEPVSNNPEWDSLTHEQKNHQLFLKQKALLDQFLETGAISKAQHDKSLHDLVEKMGETPQS
jgi:hypothetical protein